VSNFDILPTAVRYHHPAGSAVGTRERGDAVFMGELLKKLPQEKYFFQKFPTKTLAFSGWVCYNRGENNNWRKKENV